MNSKSIFLSALCAFSLATPFVQGQSETKEIKRTNWFTKENLVKAGLCAGTFIAGWKLVSYLLSDREAKILHTFSNKNMPIEGLNLTMAEGLSLSDAGCSILAAEQFALVAIYNAKFLGGIALSKLADSCIEKIYSTTDETAESNQ